MISSPEKNKEPLGVGRRFGHLTVQEICGDKLYLCLCSCGKQTRVPQSWLLAGIATNCGCRPEHALNLTGARFGRLTVEEPLPQRGADRSVCWLCRCDCGSRVVATSNKLCTGHTQSCGCKRADISRTTRTLIDGTCVENLLTDTLSVNNTSGYRGVCRKRNKWQAYITYAQKMRFLGTFDTKEEAAAARQKAEDAVLEHLQFLLSKNDPSA